MVEWSMIAGLAVICILGLLGLSYLNFKFTRQLLDTTFERFQDLRHRDYLAAKDREFRLWGLLDSAMNRVMSRDYTQFKFGQLPTADRQVAEPDEEDDSPTYVPPDANVIV